MIKIFHCLSALEGGTGNVIINWYRNIDTEKIQFDFGINNDIKSIFCDEIKRYGGNIYKIANLKEIEKPFSFFAKIKYLFNLYKILKKHGDYKVFCSHNNQSLGSFDCMIAFFAGIKKRITISHVSKNSKLNKVKLLISNLLIYLFVTDVLAVSYNAGIAQYGKHIKFKTIKNGINTKEFAYNEKERNKYRAILGVDNKFVIGYISRFDHTKNHKFMLQIFKSFYESNTNSILLLLGDGPLKKQIKQNVKNLNLTNDVIFIEPQNDINKYYQIMDIFVFPSISEGFGIVALEAQCCGLPCFISDGIPDEVIICNTTKISLTKSAQDWANTIQERIKNFKRKNCSEILTTSGFDIKDTTNQIKQIFLGQ